MYVTWLEEDHGKSAASEKERICRDPRSDKRRVAARSQSAENTVGKSETRTLVPPAYKTKMRTTLAEEISAGGTGEGAKPRNDRGKTDSAGTRDAGKHTLA